MIFKKIEITRFISHDIYSTILYCSLQEIISGKMQEIEICISVIGFSYF